MVTFDIILNARYVIMQDGSTMMIDSSMVKKIVSVAVGVNQIDLHVIGKHNVKDKQCILLTCCLFDSSGCHVRSFALETLNPMLLVTR